MRQDNSSSNNNSANNNNNNNDSAGDVNKTMDFETWQLVETSQLVVDVGDCKTN